MLPWYLHRGLRRALDANHDGEDAKQAQWSMMHKQKQCTKMDLLRRANARTSLGYACSNVPMREKPQEGATMTNGGPALMRELKRHPESYSLHNELFGVASRERMRIEWSA